ncbi:response regulator [Oceanobacillus sp. Castelsardo]|uniref:response regulator n=1 Tax=Oceanobacillus sp. Castelsardo TaxID=1851204 RepID=UPI0008396A1C|nr:response regulator [Oceanobacillus sp. Castelsardo]
MIRVLIVEDDFRIADIHAGFLKGVSNAEIIGKALTGKDAIEIVSNYEVELVLLDLYLPDISGLELIPKLRKANPNIDIIVISAATENDMVSKVIKNGVFDYMIKPVKKERFVGAFNHYTRKKRQLEDVKVFDQDLLDDVFFSFKIDSLPKSTPKGIDPLTLEKVKEIIKVLKSGITAEEMGERIGASRTTARRYLEYLISLEEITADLEYGAVGRPERKYYMMNRNIG